MASISDEGLFDNDLWIFTAKQEELTKVLAKFRNSRDIGVTMHDDKILQMGGSRYYSGEIKLRNGSICKFAITSGYKQGPQSFGIFASRVLTKHPAEYALMVGICAGDPAKDVKPEDVIFSCKSFNYEEGKRKEYDDGGEEFCPEYDPNETAPGVENAVADFVSKQKRGDYRKSPMISGASVQENAAKVFKRCQNGANRKIAALDMESSAFLEACDHCEVKALPVIKAVSDAGDKDKGDTHHGEALEKAAHAAICFVDHFFQDRITKTPTPVDSSVVGCRTSTAIKDKTGTKRSGPPVTVFEAKKREEPVSDKLLRDLSDQLCEDWEKCALELGFQEYAIASIKEEAARNRNRAKKMLQDWKKREGKGATKEALAAALDRSRLGLLADFVRGRDY